MLKQQTGSALLLRSRVHLSVPPAPARLSPEERPKRYRRKTTMASQSGSDAPEADTGRRFGGTLFPLGYKDAAYQWVSFCRASRTRVN
ncbi:hypothetical protein IMZ48_06060 [Candidatus Bathyarchaeota archaeon]|nr:hypothetical protein [Candidatus Bathyarchaeota archaeon]